MLRVGEDFLPPAETIRCLRGHVDEFEQIDGQVGVEAGAGAVQMELGARVEVSTYWFLPSAGTGDHELWNVMMSSCRRVRASWFLSVVTCVCVSGYQQANVVVLPNQLADDFHAFCRSNPAPLPLLYRSQSGETSCLPLAQHADIR